MAIAQIPMLNAMPICTRATLIVDGNRTLIVVLTTMAIAQIPMLNAMAFDSPVHICLWAWLRSSNLLQ
eukprot:2893482-Rhodomonas_salina.1